MDIEIEQLSKELRYLNNKVRYIEEIYPVRPWCKNGDKVAKNEEIELEKNINALKVVNKVAKMDHVNKLFEPKDIKILDEKYYTKEDLNDKFFGIL
ncbi:15284_t:CDS:2 [Gigaspora margarita]|uniref:15284_t:CDS:1 n=1 Tax=Gigaspora margarita TaxID=4874 RepID=A0ABM8VXW2_GIGMA|nr:15284_t:CDS:2 [Gigaspora margarita]